MKALIPFVWIMVAVVVALGIVGLIRSGSHHSPDQKILIEKSK